MCLSSSLTTSLYQSKHCHFSSVCKQDFLAGAVAAPATASRRPDSGPGPDGTLGTLGWRQHGRGSRMDDIHGRRQHDKMDDRLGGRLRGGQRLSSQRGTRGFTLWMRDDNN